MKRILVVDDDAFVTSVYRSLFQREGFEAGVASDGASAMAKLRDESWDVVILDLQLPDTSGVEVLKFIRTESTARKVPVVVFSNAFMGTMVEAAWKAGANCVLTKTQCTPNQLVQTVRDILGLTPVASSKVRRVTLADLRPPKPAPAAKATAPAPPEGVQQELLRRFREEVPRTLTQMRDTVRAFLQVRDDAARKATLATLSHLTHTVVGSTAIAGYAHVSPMASALEALFHELHNEPKIINMSILRTIVHAVDALVALCEHLNGHTPSCTAPPLALAVDDDEVSAQSLCTVLEKVGVKAVAVNDPAAALSLFRQNRFELVLLDVDMPGMDGFTLCAQMRSLPGRADTPVIFVTALPNFRNVARDKLREEDEVIGKPFVPIELTVKVLTYLLRTLGCPDGSR